MASHLFDTLTVVGADGHVEMALAESMEPNENGSEWTIELRTGVTFHDGSPLTAEDVLYTWGRVQEAGFQGSVAYGIIDLPRSEAVDTTTVRAVLTRPSFLFPLYVADIAGGVVRAGTVDFEASVGTGPFTFGSSPPGGQRPFSATRGTGATACRTSTRSSWCSCRRRPRPMPCWRATRRTWR